jgi:hypothetical protein
MVMLPGLAQAQFGGASGKHSSEGKPGARPLSGPAPDPIAPKAEPRQRLDRGAMLCQTEADLAQHQAAIEARLDGQFAAEPVGCSPVRTMTPVKVLDRHGIARTQVKLLGKPEQIGWTDAVVHD